VNPLVPPYLFAAVCAAVLLGGITFAPVWAQRARRQLAAEVVAHRHRAEGSQAVEPVEVVAAELAYRAAIAAQDAARMRRETPAWTMKVRPDGVVSHTRHRPKPIISEPARPAWSRLRRRRRRALIVAWWRRQPVRSAAWWRGLPGRTGERIGRAALPVGEALAPVAAYLFVDGAVPLPPYPGPSTGGSGREEQPPPMPAPAPGEPTAPELEAAA
jgi:hypothetical protein